MIESMISDGALIRFSIFLALFIVFALWEIIAPRRMQIYPKAVRWVNNLSISTINALITWLFVPVTVLFVAASVQSSGYGLLNMIDMPHWISIIVAVLFLDFAIYVQHVIFHKVGFLWRLHRMHHADLEFDVTTAVRFHPIEIILSLGIKLCMVTLIGAPVIAVLIFEVLLNATSLFNHSNIRIPKSIEKIMRLFVVTPEMHRVHHSIIQKETDSNFGFNLPWWDYIFRTYRAQPKMGHLKMTIGIESFRDKRELWLDRLLLQPFRNAN